MTGRTQSRRLATVLAAGFSAGMLAACSTIEQSDTPPNPLALCAGGALGRVVVAPLTHWRADQKEKDKREEIAMQAIKASLEKLACGEVAKIRAIAQDAYAADALAEAKASGADTLLTLRIEELGPILIISVPALWSTWSEVKFSLKAETIATGLTRMHVTRHRKVGGAFALRGVGPLRQEFEAALGDLIGR